VLCLLASVIPCGYYTRMYFCSPFIFNYVIMVILSLYACWLANYLDFNTRQTIDV
jgi:hypothetical protein